MRRGLNQSGSRSERPIEPLERRLLMAAVAGRFVFYNDSAFDGNGAAAGAADDAAIATDKQALRPGQAASFANYTSYSKGLNGVMIDITALQNTPTLADFQFRAGNGGSPSTWAAAPAPTVHRRSGAGGAERITLVWPNNAIQKKWLQVTVLPSSNTGITAPDVFYFGNAVGESGSSAGDAVVNGTDFAGARDNQRGSQNPAPIDWRWDYNRDRLVNGTDLAIARDNTTSTAAALQLFTAPAAPTAQSASVAVDFTSSRNDLGQAPMSPGEQAGAVVRQPNWNSTPQPAAGQQAVSGTLPNLKNQAGQTTAASVTFAAPNNYSNRYNEGADGDYHMMDGYLDPSADAPATVTFSNLPFAGTYDVYVYADGDSGEFGENWRVGTYTISGAGSGNASVSKGDPIQNYEGNTWVYDEGSDYYAVRPAGGLPDDRNPMKPVGGGNYIVFRGVSGSSFTLTAQGNAQLTASAQGDLPRAPVNGIQIVGTTLSGGGEASSVAAAPAEPLSGGEANTGRMIAVDPLSVREEGQAPLASATVAGAPGVRQPWWNPLPVGGGDSFGNNAVYSSLRDNAGNLTPLAIAGFIDSNYRVGFNAGLSSDHQMMNGYFDTGAFLGGRPTILSFTGVPYATYDVWVYCDGNNHPGQNDRYGVYTLGTTPDRMPTPMSIRKYDTPASENQQTGSTFNYDDATVDGVGNYIVFRNVTGPRFTLLANPVAGGNPRASINGIQIVETTGGGRGAAVTVAEAKPTAPTTPTADDRRAAPASMPAFTSRTNARIRRATADVLGVE